MHPTPEKTPHIGIRISKYRKSSEKISERNQDGGNILPMRETKIIIIADISLGASKQEEWSQNKEWEEKKITNLS